MRVYALSARQKQADLAQTLNRYWTLNCQQVEGLLAVNEEELKAENPKTSGSLAFEL